MDYFPTEILVNIAQYVHTRDIKCLRCVCTSIKSVFDDSYFMDIGDIKLYKHQQDTVKFLLDREAVGLNSIVNLDTGIGKTATVIYAYNLNPIPTLIVAKAKIHSVWIEEMSKYNISLPICIPTKVHTLDNLHTFKRIIYDEIHETPSGSKDKKDLFIESIKGKVVWGLSASHLSITNSMFRAYHLYNIFGAPDCMITIKSSEIEDEAKCNFVLPKFQQVDFATLSTDYIYTRYPDMTKYQSILRYIRAITRLSKSNKYDALSYMLYNDMVSPCEYINDDGSFLIDGKLTTSVDQRDIEFLITSMTTSAYEEFLSNKVNEYSQQGTKRTIVYCKTDPYAVYRSIIGATTESVSYDVSCYMFIKGKCNVLIIPPSYNAGFNFGKIDVIIIINRVSYIQFHQIMGRVNRLNTNNKDTIVYLPTNNAGTNFSDYITKYQSQFISE